jgi:hypothetical protein
LGAVALDTLSPCLMSLPVDRRKATSDMDNFSRNYAAVLPF